MNFSKNLLYFGFATVVLFQSCTEEKKEETVQEAPVIVITNNDIEQARELYISNPVIDSTWLIDSSNVGYGQRQDFNADSALVKHMYASEENTDWYKFVAPTDTSLAITVEPNDPFAEYDMVVFKSTGDSIGPDLRKGLVPAIRSNFAKRSLPEDTITGLGCYHKLHEHNSIDSVNQFSRAFWIKNGETYFVVLNTPDGKGKGYKLRIHSCAPGEQEIGNKASSTKVKKTTEVPQEQAQPNKIKNATKKSTHNESRKPAKTWKPRKIVKKSQPADNGDYYIVKPKDTMFSIAFIFGMTVDEILKLNKLDNTNVFVGQKLKVIRRQLPQKPVEKKVTKAPVTPPAKPEKVTPEPAQVPEPMKVADTPLEEVKEIVNKTAKFTQTENIPKEQKGLETKTEGTNALAPADKSFYVYCNVTSSVTKLPVQGTLQVVDLKKKNLVYSILSNKTQKVPLFNEGGKQKLIIADIFGYRKQDFDLNLDNIINDSTAQQVTIVDDTIVINFEMQRLKKNDVAVAYNIFFYDDASVMLPKSTYELDQLLELMNENKNIKIKIHGHTNTSKLGKILYLEKGDNNFFRLTARNKETFGTAAQLSKKRAETIRYYLISKRIGENRVETEGHGGSQMLYPNTHPLAFKNKRVEIEILAD